MTIMPARVVLAVLLLVMSACGWDSSPDIDALHTKAELGDVDAQGKLGLIYLRGLDVPQDYQEAARWLLAAANQGHSMAQYSLGGMYYTGEGIPQDYEEAIRWYQASAKQGNVLAQNNLGWLYATAEDLSFRDPKESLEYAKKAVEGSQGKDPGILDTLAEAYFFNREYDMAIQTITKALTLRPDWDYLTEQLQKFEQAEAKE